ncbi:hypothetical protein Q4485_16285 [Granulosicoccaceae sp. 1_MG-2023]|nr:hypothetical protein [Granulosicoccaceae sp. 1_MG-2023]
MIYKLLSMALTLWADRQFPDYIDLRRFTLYGVFARLMLSLGVGRQNGIIGYVLLTALPALIVVMVIGVFGIFDPLKIPLWALVLYFCLPEESLSKAVGALRGAVASGKPEEVTVAAAALAGQENLQGDVSAMAQRGLFAVQPLQLVSLFFWFLLLGIGAAVFYRLNLELLRTPVLEGSKQAFLRARVQQVLGILEWLPARLLIIAYALAGQFNAGIRPLFGSSPDGGAMREGLLSRLQRAGTGAAGIAGAEFGDQAVADGWRLVSRALIGLLIVFGVLALMQGFK